MRAQVVGNVMAKHLSKRSVQSCALSLFLLLRTTMYIDDGDYLQLKNEIMLGYTGMGDLNFVIFFIFRVENIALSSANSHLISSLQVFFSFPVPIPGYITSRCSLENKA